MESQVKLVGVIKEVTYRKTRTSESFYQRCDFILESKIHVICEWFYPSVRRGYKVKMVGELDDDLITFYAKGVERIHNQTQLDLFNQQRKKEVKEQ
jgi:hypothetical protein